MKRSNEGALNEKEVRADTRGRGSVLRVFILSRLTLEEN